MNLPPTSSVSPKQGRKTGFHFAWIIILVILLIAILAGISFMQTRRTEYKSYPEGKYLLYFRNEDGKPVSDVTMTVSERRSIFSISPPYQTMLVNAGSLEHGNGTIVLQFHYGYYLNANYLTTCGDLFGVIPVCVGRSRYDVEFTASEYKTLRMPLERIMFLARAGGDHGPTTILIEIGEPVEVPLYELQLTMERK